jgi:hypothetical protein
VSVSRKRIHPKLNQFRSTTYPEAGAILKVLHQSLELASQDSTMARDWTRLQAPPRQHWLALRPELIHSGGPPPHPPYIRTLSVDSQQLRIIVTCGCTICCVWDQGHQQLKRPLSDAQSKDRQLIELFWGQIHLSHQDLGTNETREEHTHTTYAEVYDLLLVLFLCC